MPDIELKLLVDHICPIETKVEVVLRISVCSNGKLISNLTASANMLQNK